MDKLIVIVGATATQKSKLALTLAQDLNTEIINADSFQVYRELNVGINKPTEQELKDIKHHFINCISIYDEFDIKIYQDWCNQKINEIHQSNKIPILCGGSNLYIDAVIKGYDLNKSDGRNEIKYFDNWSYDQIYNYVLEHDKQEALKINYNNTKRIIRAAQIIYTTNKPKSEIDNQKDQYIYDTFIIETCTERDKLYERINNRVDQMISNSWVQEVNNLYIQNPNIINLQALKAIGYKQILDSIINNNIINIDLIKQTTRQLAKKQMTWNRNKYNLVHKFDISTDNYENLINKIRNFLD